MNVSFLRVMIVIALGAAHLFGIMTHGYAGAATAKAPLCGMACCVQGECECQAIPADAPPQPIPIAPVAGEQAMKFVPMMLSSLPAPVVGGPTIPVLLHSLADRGVTWSPPIFRLQCAMLM